MTRKQAKKKLTHNRSRVKACPTNQALNRRTKRLAVDALRFCKNYFHPASKLQKLILLLKAKKIVFTLQ